MMANNTNMAPAQSGHKQPTRLVDVYDLEQEQLAEGSEAAVYRGTHKQTFLARAIRKVSKHDRNREKLQREVAIFQRVDHPNIIKLHEIIEDDRNMYQVMELCTGGEVFERIVKAGNFTELESVTVMQQLMGAVLYMHRSGICHRDLKPENLIFQTPEPVGTNTLKVIDFGCACTFKPDHPLSQQIGSPGYAAPEVLAGCYNHECDLWSCGVIMYIALSGSMPFYGRSRRKLLTRVRRGKFAFKRRKWDHVSDAAKELICVLLQLDPRDRYSAEVLLKHRWFSETLLGVMYESPAVDRDANCGFDLEKKVKEAITSLQDFFGALGADDRVFDEGKGAKKHETDPPADAEYSEEDAMEKSSEASNQTEDEWGATSAMGSCCGTILAGPRPWPPRLFGAERMAPTMFPACWST